MNWSKTILSAPSSHCQRDWLSVSIQRRFVGWKVAYLFFLCCCYLWSCFLDNICWAYKIVWLCLWTCVAAHIYRINRNFSVKVKWTKACWKCCIQINHSITQITSIGIWFGRLANSSEHCSIVWRSQRLVQIWKRFYRNSRKMNEPIRPLVVHISARRVVSLGNSLRSVVR